MLAGGQLGRIGTKKESLIGCASLVSALRLAEWNLCGKNDAFSASEQVSGIGVRESG